MKNLLQSILIITLLILCSSTTEAFDGNRKGFVLGGGVRLAQFFSSGVIDNNYYPGDNIFTIDFSLGYAFNDRNLIAFDRSISTLKTERNDKFALLIEVEGTSWYHYFSKQKKSYFTKFGYEPSFKIIILGGGYMFSNNIQIGMTYSHPTEIDDRDNIKLLLSYVAF